MNPKAIGALLILVFVTAPIHITLCEEMSRYLYRSTYTFENRGAYAYRMTEEDATLALFHNNSWQTVWIHNATHSVAFEYLDVDGNRLAVMEMPPEIPPNSTLTFSITHKVESSDRPKPNIDPVDAGSFSDIPQSLVEEFCVETETFTTEDEAIRSLALSLATNQTTVLGLVIRLLVWFEENISFDSFEVPRYPNETLAQGMGDCDDQAILLITICRALNVPAILQVGLVFDEGIESERSSWGDHLHIELKKVGWHGWALVYIPPWGWLPIDMTLFRNQDPFSRIADAPEYESFVVTAFNVSRQVYIGDSHLSRERLMASDVYITVSETVVEEASSSSRTKLHYIVLGLSVGSAIVVVIILLSRRRWR